MLSKKEQKFIKSLKVKKYRHREKQFLVEGAKSVREVLDSDFEVEMVVGTAPFLQELSGSAEGLRTEEASASLMAQLGTFKTNNSGLAVVKEKPMRDLRWDGTDHLFVLDGVGDPGNLGTIIRTLDWFGFGDLLCSADCAEFYHPKTIASSMGSFTRVKVCYGTLDEILPTLKVPILGAEAGGKRVDQMVLKKPSVIVMGSESQGIRATTRYQLTGSISIPKFGKAESLNVAMATGIIAGYLRMF